MSIFGTADSVETIARHYYQNIIRAFRSANVVLTKELNASTYADCLKKAKYDKRKDQLLRSFNDPGDFEVEIIESILAEEFPA